MVEQSSLFLAARPLFWSLCGGYIYRFAKRSQLGEVVSELDRSDRWYACQYRTQR